MTQVKTLEELEAYRNRLESDIRRSRMMDADGITKNSPLLVNFEQVNKDIAALKEQTND
jgi:hypothetical protein